MKKPIFPTLIIFVLLIIGCAKSDSKKSKEIDVFVGFEGLTAEFAKNAPPQKVFEDNNFPILLRVRNIGAYNVPQDKKGIISIAREKDYITDLSLEESSMVSKGQENEALFYIDGKTRINPKGNEIIVSFNAKTGKLDPQSEQRASAITATLCYPYKTTLSTTVCIDPDVAGIRPGKKVCNVRELAFSNGQGAPIAVTKIEPQMVPEGDIIKPQFLIFIENKGKGNPAHHENYKSICGKDDTGKDLWNVAFLKAFTAGKEGENQLECSPNIEGNSDKNTAFIRFRDKKDFVRCTINKEIKEIKRSDDAFTSPLRIEIDYGYVQTIATNFAIQKPLRY